VVVLEVLGVALWSVLGLAGAWLLLTGRKMVFGLPKSPREGWPLRAFGLAYLLLAMFLIYQESRGSFSPDGVVFSYVFFAVALAVALNRRWRTPASGSAEPSR
jgi:hypothetical protein